VADTVMRGGRASSATPALPAISRLQRCSCGGSRSGGGLCPECAKKQKEEMQRSASGAGGVDTAPPIVHDVLRSAGQPLDAGARAFFEPRFGHGFGDVRVHTDGRAAESARAVGAVAYTVGRDVVFGAGMYRPQTPEGRRLLAHELAHTVQQQGSGPVQGPLRVEAPGTPAEREADAAAHAVSGPAGAQGRGAAALTGRPPALSRRLEAPAVQRSVQTLCEPPGFWLPGPQSAAFGIIAEKFIEADYMPKMGVAPPATAYFDDSFAGPIDPRYGAFLLSRNPGLAPWKAVFLSITPVSRPDMLADNGVLREFDEIKPMSVPGVSSGFAKLVEIMAVMSTLGLPYVRGTTYAPTPNIPIASTMLPGGIPFTLSIAVTRAAAGLILYRLCITTDFVTLSLLALAAVLIAILAFLARGVRVPSTMPAPGMASADAPPGTGDTGLASADPAAAGGVPGGGTSGGGTSGGGASGVA